MMLNSTIQDTVASPMAASGCRHRRKARIKIWPDYFLESTDECTLIPLEERILSWSCRTLSVVDCVAKNGISPFLITINKFFMTKLCFLLQLC
eukprot:m.48250 g.48250  ORF g.48250 m.48250 type:complete len:93 (-) comp15256_c0_seq2:249-527(-)